MSAFSWRDRGKARKNQSYLRHCLGGNWTGHLQNVSSD